MLSLITLVTKVSAFVPGRLRRAAMVLMAAAVLALAFPALIAEADSGAPQIPHSTSGKEQCLTCHGVQSIKPVPLNHAAFDERTCLGCHSTPTASSKQQDSCLSCHSQPGLSMSLTSGETLSLYVDPQVFAASIHGDKLLCTDCHTSTSTYPHPQREITSRREYNIAQYELCRRCHFVNYTKTLDSVHYEMLSGGDLKAPLCTDCHGAHNVTSPSQPRAKISLTCSRCHQDLYAMYADSVHGKALIQEDNYDVPVCTDCHMSHTIEDPRTASFRLRSVELCSRCHGNEELMQKYGISTMVVKTYLEDFHGRTVALLEKQGRDISPNEAVCTDCHGAHDIHSADNSDTAAMKERLLATCRKCHPGATANFPSAWLSHYEPSVNKASLVFWVRRFYWVFIPFVLIGLCMHVMVDIWRAITNR